MQQGKSVLCMVVIFVVILTIHHAQARPSRMKRVSDQRLAEIETLLALSKYRGMLSTVPVGHGKIDYHKIGRRRRAANLLWRELLDDSNEPDSGDLVEDSEELIDPQGAGLNYQQRAGLDYRQLGDVLEGDSPHI